MDAGIGATGPRLYVRRYTPLQRINHWIVAICFVLLTMSGLAMFYPWLWWLASFFGGGPPTRAVHPWIGVALFVSFFFLSIQFIRNNIWNRDDIRWLMRFRSVMTNDHEGLPDLGKYNAGQKGVYWSQFLLIPILLVTGLLSWQKYFGSWVSIPTHRAAILAHALAALIAITVIIVHIYAGIWIKGTGRAMTRGTVTGGWAYVHHRKWLREMLRATAKRRPADLGSAKSGGD